MLLPASQRSLTRSNPSSLADRDGGKFQLDTGSQEVKRPSVRAQAGSQDCAQDLRVVDRLLRLLGPTTHKSLVLAFSSDSAKSLLSAPFLGDGPLFLDICLVLTLSFLPKCSGTSCPGRSSHRSKLNHIQLVCPIHFSGDPQSDSGTQARRY